MGWRFASRSLHYCSVARAWECPDTVVLLRFVVQADRLTASAQNRAMASRLSVPTCTIKAPTVRVALRVARVGPVTPRSVGLRSRKQLGYTPSTKGRSMHLVRAEKEQDKEVPSLTRPHPPHLAKRPTYIAWVPRQLPHSRACRAPAAFQYRLRGSRVRCITKPASQAVTGCCSPQTLSALDSMVPDAEPAAPAVRSPSHTCS